MKTVEARTIAVVGAIGICLITAAWNYSALLAWRHDELLPRAGQVEGPLRVSVIVCLIYLFLIFLIDVTLLVVAVSENAVLTRQSRAESYDTIARSRFTIPVSVIVPMRNEEILALPVIQALLELDYPELEVIVVNDGSTDRTLDLLSTKYALQANARFQRPIVPTEEVHAVYRSGADQRLTVVDKVGGGKADALNCGLNFARFRYVCCVDGDTMYDRDALLRSMRLVLRDPATVIGVTSQIVVAVNPERSLQSDGLARNELLQNFQHMEYLRAFLNDRLAWSRLGFMLCASGAFALYRRDVLEELGGFSRDFSCEDIELTFRIHESFLRQGRPYRILAMPDPVARTEGPNRISGLVSQRARWQRVMLETTWHYRKMILNPRYGTVGLVGLPFYVLSEVVAPFGEAVALVTLAVAVAFGVVTWHEYFLALGVMSFANAALTAAAIRLEDVGTRSYRIRDLAWLIALSPFELFLYRPMLFWAHMRGVVGFFRGEKTWERFDRNARPVGEAPLPAPALE